MILIIQHKEKTGNKTTLDALDLDLSMDSKVILIYSCKILQYSLFRKLVLLSPNYREKCQNENNFYHNM